ncbi:MAG: ABC transporter substrate-binding protein [Porphyromonas sp.]|nr:ABC transporter substrate-binding protein [Porphyromonas sp.]
MFTKSPYSSKTSFPKVLPGIVAVLFCSLLGIWFSCSLSEEDPYPELEVAHPDVLFAEYISISHNVGAQHRVFVLDTTRQDTLARYLLVPREEAETMPHEPNERVIPIPVERIVCLGSSSIGAVEMLELQNRIVGIERGLTLYDNEINNLQKKGIIATLGEGSDLDVQKIKQLNPDIILWSPLPYNVDSSRPPTELMDRVVLYRDTFERTPLSRSEWLKFIGLLTGKAKTADSIFSASAHRYESLRLIAKNHTEKSKVVFAQKVDGVWCIPAPGGYADHLLNDAHCIFTPPQGGSPTGSVLTTPQLIQYFYDADYWLMWEIDGVRNLADFAALDPDYQKIKAYQEGQIYLNTRLVDIQGKNSYWEQGWYHPDLILQDLIYILHPNLKAHGVMHNYWMQLQ